MASNEGFIGVNNDTPFPTIHIVSDSLGATAHSLARAAAGQFGYSDPYIETLPKVRSFNEIASFLAKHQESHRAKGKPDDLVVFYTLVDDEMRHLMQAFCDERGMHAVDLMGGPISALEKASGLEASRDPGLMRTVDQNYFRRIAAMEFTVEHDDGRNPQDLPDADIVLLGVSRSSKTPISIYMGMEGYKVANVPLALGTEPPKEIYDCDPSRIFRPYDDSRCTRRHSSAPLGRFGAHRFHGCRELRRARNGLSRPSKKLARLCENLDVVIRTDNKAVEETAQEILLRYFEPLAHPLQKCDW